MMNSGGKHHYTFKRLETDEEFRKRLVDAGVERWKLAGNEKDLDDAAWAAKKMQRRIIDDFA